MPLCGIPILALTGVNQGHKNRVVRAAKERFSMRVALVPPLQNPGWKLPDLHSDSRARIQFQIALHRAQVAAEELTGIVALFNNVELIITDRTRLDAEAHFADTQARQDVINALRCDARVEMGVYDKVVHLRSMRPETTFEGAPASPTNLHQQRIRLLWREHLDFHSIGHTQLQHSIDYVLRQASNMIDT